MKTQKLARTIRFLKSAAAPKDFPPEGSFHSPTPEVALAGRSNSGKSSFINLIGHLYQERNPSPLLAKVSQTPGKTRLLNFFEVRGKGHDHHPFRWVDMPGYGFAARSLKEQEAWAPVIEVYLSQRKSLAGLLLLMDIRRSWTSDEEQLRQFCHSLPLVVVLTKTDKLRPKELLKRKKDIQIASGLPPHHIFETSSLKKQGGEAVEHFVYTNWIKSWNDPWKEERLCPHHPS